MVCLTFLGYCNIDTNLNTFKFMEGTDYLQAVTDGENYCITNKGSNPSRHDTIHAKPCRNHRDYKGTFVPKAQKTTTITTTTKSTAEPVPMTTVDLTTTFAPEATATTLEATTTTTETTTSTPEAQHCNQSNGHYS